jgi:hypothetical protein
LEYDLKLNAQQNPEIMNAEKFKKTFQYAESELNRARNELYKPAEDVVNYSVCVSARSAIHHYMYCMYMMVADENKEKLEETPTIDFMMKYCTESRKDLWKLDFNVVHCRHKNVLEDEEAFFYCEDVDKVGNCTRLAESIRKVLLETTPKEYLPDVKVF